MRQEASEARAEQISGACLFGFALLGLGQGGAERHDGIALSSYIRWPTIILTGALAMSASTSKPLRLIRLPEVMQRTGHSRAWIYLAISKGRFPKQIKLGSRAVAWIESEIDDYIQQLITDGRDPEKAPTVVS